MNDLMSVVDWSRAQFALTAMYHWLFVPLTLGLSVIVAVMETIYYRTGSERWKAITKFWMKLFGINFALGVATGIILEFEFGTNWSNYSWFVGDIFGAPLAIEGLLAFFMESTFIAVMFFGWGKVSKGFHLSATWLTAIGATLSATWILIANAWMQNPVGMEFDPAQMRNVMDNFSDVVLNPVAIHKFFHAVFSGWALAGIFVIGVSCWFMLLKHKSDFVIRSVKVGGWIGVTGMIVTLWSGDGSAVDVATYQPMKLAAMEGLYDGGNGVEISAFGILDPEKKPGDNRDPFLFNIAIPNGLSFLATHDFNGYVAGINDLSAINAGRIERGKRAHEALRAYDTAAAAADTAAMNAAAAALKSDYRDFGYGYLSSPDEAIPPVALTYYSFHIMVITGSYIFLFLLIALWAAYRAPELYSRRWWQWLALLTIAVVWVCSQSGWITAEVGRQPWIIEGLMPARAAISFISTETVRLTFWLFAAIFTALLAAEMSIMVKAIVKGSKTDYSNIPD